MMRVGFYEAAPELCTKRPLAVKSIRTHVIQLYVI